MSTNLIPVQLTCEYVVNPIGVHSQSPLLGWRCEDVRRGGRQSAYRILAASSKGMLEEGSADIWDSGKVEEARNASVPYRGPALKSEQRIWWKVCIWDENGIAGEYSEPAFFEMGLLARAEWKGSWMGFLGGLHGQGLLMRKDFELKNKPVKARAHIAGLGYYELRLNGKKAGDKLLDPGSTDYGKTILYSSYDITDELNKGANTVGAILGNGWSGAPKMILQLNVEYADGSREEVHTAWGINWYCTGAPITYNGLYDGEDYDARLERDGWDTPEYDFESVAQKPGGWILATIVEDPGGELVPELMEPIRVMETFQPDLIHTLADGTKIYDIGQNIAGWVRIGIRGKAGAKVVLKFAESLLPDHSLNMVNLRLARATDNYILRGTGKREEYAPRFTYHGFRYFSVNTEGNPELLDLTAEFVRSGVERAVRFECDNPLLNRIAEAMYYTDAGNMHSIPTDCCQRDERQGWINDVSTRAEGSTYHFNVAAFYEKWLRDVYDTQNDFGSIADTAPYRWGYLPCDPLTNAPIGIPLLLYRNYGNRRILETYYGRMKKYFASLQAEADGLIIERSIWGDWASPATECIEEKINVSAKSKHTPGALVSTSFFYLHAVQLSEIARILDIPADATWYDDMAKKIRYAFNARFLNPETAQYDSGSQGCNAIPAALGLVPEQYLDRVIQNIDDDVARRGYHLSTGSQGTKQMLNALAGNGKIDTAFKLMTGTTYPGFGFMLENGATTIWERWEADNINNVMNSRNHPMHASPCVWFYKHLAGLMPAPDAVALDKVVISPRIPQGLNRVSMEWKTINGTIETSWIKNGTQLSLNAVIPFNMTARVILPIPVGADLEKVMATESGKPVFLNGAPAAGKGIADISAIDGLQAGIRSVEAREEGIAVEIGSGKYEFVVGVA